MTPKTRHPTIVVAAIAILAVVVVGCDSQHGASPPPSEPVTSVHGSSPASARPTSDRDAIEAAYEAFWSVSWGLDQFPHEQWREVLSEVAIDPALTTVLANTGLHARNGITLYGAVVPHITDVHIDADHATVTDCQDGSDAGQADANTGERKTVGVERSPVTATLARSADGTWRVSESHYTGGDC